MKLVIYGLIATDEPIIVRYIGLTNQALEVRLKQHLHELKSPQWQRRDFRKADWMREVIERGSTISIIALAEADSGTTDIPALELSFIQKHKVSGLLLNLDGVSRAYRKPKL